VGSRDKWISYPIKNGQEEGGYMEETKVRENMVDGLCIHVK
jgi:hypothetical protein